MEKPSGYEEFKKYQQYERAQNKNRRSRFWFKLAFIFFVIGLLFPWAWAVTILCILIGILSTFL